MFGFRMPTSFVGMKRPHRATRKQKFGAISLIYQFAEYVSAFPLMKAGRLRVNNVFVFMSLCLLAIVSAIPSKAFSNEMVIANYNVSYKGYRIGKAKFKAEINAKNYDMKIGLEEAGLISLFSSVSGQAASRGRISALKFLPKVYGLDVRANSKDYKTDIAFKGNHLGTVKVLPKPKQKDIKARVPLKKSEVVNAYDPVSALMDIRTNKAASLSKNDCKRKKRIFEGRYLFDLVLRYEKMAAVKSSSGLVKNTVVCKGHLVYYSGHKIKGPSTTKEIVTVWLAKSRSGRFVLPFKIDVQLKNGLLGIEAYAFR